MAEFQEVCKHLKRMCERYGNNCIECPLNDKDFCSLSAGDRTTETYKKAEEIIMSWAAEHPEPVYPTWAEWLNSIGVIISDRPFQALNIPVYVYQASTKMLEPIPANIAEKLGIIPKESN